MDEDSLDDVEIGFTDGYYQQLERPLCGVPVVCFKIKLKGETKVEAETSLVQIG